MPYVRNTPHWKPVLGLLNGGLDMAVNAFYGSDTAWHVECEAAPSKILAHRWPDVPNHGDVTQIDWNAVEPVDILTGGYPCQPFSAAGRRQGTNDERHLWPYVRDAIRHLRPRLTVLENVAGHRSLGFDRVLGDLAEDGLDARWVSVRASDIGAPHHRERVFIVASDPRCVGLQAGHQRPGRPDASQSGNYCGGPPLPDSCGIRLDGRRTAPKQADRAHTAADRHSAGVEWGRYAPAVRRWERLTRPAPSPTEPGRVGKPRLNTAFSEWMMGLPEGHVTAVPGLSRADQLKAIGNGVCPHQAYRALEILHHIAFLESAS